jgi:hypothetical protein
MPAHLRAALTQTQLSIPVVARPAGTRHLARHLPVRASPGAAPAVDALASDRHMSLDSVRAWLAAHAPELR